MNRNCDFMSLQFIVVMPLFCIPGGDCAMLKPVVGKDKI